MPRSIRSCPVLFTLLASGRLPRVYARADLDALAAFVLAAEGVKGPASLTLDLTTPTRIRMLNRRFRGVDRATDVISFRYDPLALPSPRGKRKRVRGFLEGDIAINIAQAAIQAKKMHHSARREVRLLWIHGLLHLLDYTDYEPRPRRRMFRRQNQLLRAWERRHP